MFTVIIQNIFVFLAIVTSMGTLVHDAKLNRAYALAMPLEGSSISLSSHLDSLHEGTSHTHVESVTQFVSEANPRIQARDDHRKYYLPRYMTSGNPFSGGASYQWPSV